MSWYLFLGKILKYFCLFTYQLSDHNTNYFYRDKYIHN